MPAFNPKKEIEYKMLLAEKMQEFLDELSTDATLLIHPAAAGLMTNGAFCVLDAVIEVQP